MEEVVGLRKEEEAETDDEMTEKIIEDFEIIPDPDVLVSYFCILCGKYEEDFPQERNSDGDTEPAASASGPAPEGESDKEKIFGCLCDLLNVKPKMRSSWNLRTEALPLCKPCEEISKELLEIKEEIASLEVKLKEKVHAVRKMVADSEEVLSSTLTGSDVKVTDVNLGVGGTEDAATQPVEGTAADAAEPAAEIIQPAVSRDERFHNFRRHILDLGSKKKKGRKPNQKAKQQIKEEGDEGATAPSAVEVKVKPEEPVKRTSRGRVIKRPEMFRSYAQNLDDAILEEDEELDDSSETAGILVPKVEMESSENEEEEEFEQEDPEWSPGHGLDQAEYQIVDSDYSSSGSDDDMDFEIDGEAEEEDLTKELTGDEEGPPKSKKAKQNRTSRTQRKTKRKSRARVRDDDESLERTEEGKSRKNFSKIPIKIMADGESYDGFFMKEETETVLTETVVDKEKSVLELETFAIGENVEVVMEDAEIDQEQVQDQIQDPAESVEIVAIPNAGEVIFIEESLPGIRIRCSEKGCRRTFSTLTKVKVHIKRKHLGIAKPYSCSMCDKCFQLPGLLRKHMADHGVEYLDGKSTRKTHTCEYEDCGQTFRNPATLVNHVRSVHTGERPFRCTLCPDTAALESSFVTKVKLEFHTEQAHPDIPPLKCEYCPRGFYRPHRLREHTKAHTGEKSYLCDICSKSFGQLSQFKIHQSIHEGNPINRYRCEQCEGIFTSAQNLKLHQQTQHGNEYRFHCEICGQGVTHLSILKIHMRSHTGEKPYSCEVCSRTFRLTSQLRVHMRTHTGERPYQCQICEKTFAISGKLRRHELIHAQEREFKCQFCEKSFIKPCNLMQHTKRAHGTVVIMEIN